MRFNDAVRAFNTAQKEFPAVIYARWLGFTPQKYFRGGARLEGGAEGRLRDRREAVSRDACSRSGPRYGWRMPTWTRPIALVLAAGLVACEGGGGSDHARMEALASRVEQLEKRLAAGDKNARTSIGSGTTPRASTGASPCSRRACASSRRALRAAASLSPRRRCRRRSRRPAASTGPQIRERPLTGDRRMDRRTQLRALSDEFRSKVAELRSQPQADQQQSAQELLQWYREQRRAILRGGARTDQPAEPAQ